MATTTADPIAARVKDLHDYIAQGRILEAMDEFYDPAVEMQDNLEPPCVGLAANVEREKAWLDSVAEFTSFEVKCLAVEGDTSFAETTMGFRTKDGQQIDSAQVSRAVWKDGRIVNERFYHA